MLAQATNGIGDVSKRLENFLNTIQDAATKYGMKILVAIIILVIGMVIVRWIGKLVDKWLEKHHLEPPLKMLLVRVVRLVLMLGVLVVTLDNAGVQVTTLLAGIGVLGVGLGLALQGVLSNLVAGLTIIFTKPFRVGEYVELLGNYGQVRTIELFSTTLLHPDLSRVVIPNRKIVGEIMHNYGHIRQLDMTVGVAYNSDLTQVAALIREIVTANPRVLKEPAPGIGISLLGGSSISVSVKPWTNIPDFGPAQAEIYQAIVDRFREKGISIPFPQREVRLLGNG
jgi:small conductance mechanosensitive channel